MTLPVLGDYRARGIALPSDGVVAQDIIDKEVAWLARKLGGSLEGERTETFHVGYSRTAGKLSLRRYTSAVTLVDGGSAVAADQYRLVDDGAAIERIEPNLPWWTGPYVVATYTPNDLDEIERALYDLVALAVATGPSAGVNLAVASETIGAYSYSVGGGAGTVAQSRIATRAVIVASLIPKRDPLVSLAAVSRNLSIEDPVINRAELPL